MTRRVVVVGGGLAGMAAALRAADGGAEVILVERRAHLGGLTWSFSRRGLRFDNGQHVFLKCCTSYMSFLERIGASSQVRLQRRLDIPVLSPHGTRARITRSALPAPLHLTWAIARYRHLSPAERARLVRAVLGLRSLRLDDPSLDAETFGRWLARHGQSPAAIERLWDLVTLPTVNVPATEASLTLGAKVFRTGLLDRSDGADMGWSAVPLSVLHGENATRALAAAGVETLLGTAVTNVSTDLAGTPPGSADDHAAGTVDRAPAADPVAGAGRSPRLSVTAGGRVIAADAVVAALPPPAATSLLPAGAVGDVGALGTSPIVNVHLVLDRRVTDLPLAAAVGSPVQFVFDHTEASGLEPAAGQQCLVVSLSAADRYVGRRPDELVRAFHAALGDLFPRARRAGLVDAVVTRERSATFRGVPGTAALRPGPRTRVPGLFLAGAWCDTGWPATMEGAVRSGDSAAMAALAFLAGAPSAGTAGAPSPGGAPRPPSRPAVPSTSPPRLDGPGAPAPATTPAMHEQALQEAPA